MEQRLVRINSLDNIEQPGILYTPNSNTKKLVIHVHGLNGNFYENRFLDNIARAYTDKNYAFLTFNNRGRDYIVDLIKGEDFVTIGGSLERFKDCILDIDGVVKWAKENNYTEIVLEGHSYGCNKILYYYNKKKDDSIKKIVLLAPCDVPSEGIKFIEKEEYSKTKEESERLVKEGKEEELIYTSIMANHRIAAGTYYYDFLPGGEDDFIRYVDGPNAKSEVLSNINIPTLIIFGDVDECVLTQPINVVTSYLKNNIKDCNIEIIEGANHSYINRYNELEKTIRDNID